LSQTIAEHPFATALADLAKQPQTVRLPS